MWRENITRDELHEVLQTFSNILLVTVHEAFE